MVKILVLSLFLGGCVTTGMQMELEKIIEEHIHESGANDLDLTAIASLLGTAILTMVIGRDKIKQRGAK